jgi:predicted Holliday junction resolvase-like endonuclease
MNAALLGLALGFGLGVALFFLQRRHVEERRARDRFERWVATDSRRAVRQQVDGRRGEVKRSLGLDLAPSLPALPFEAADARFLGHPAHFVIFDGHTDVKDRGGEMREIAFVTVRSPYEGAPVGGVEGGPDDAALIDECLSAGRVRWSTLRHP